MNVRVPSACAVLCLVTLALFAACEPAGGGGRVGSTDNVREPWRAAPAWAGAIAALHEDVGAEYTLAPAASGGEVVASAANPAQRLEIELLGSAVRAVAAASAGATWSVELEWTGVGRGDAIEPVPAATRGPELMGNRASYWHGAGRSSFYINGSRGLEQGFVLAEAPEGQGGPVVLEVRAGGGPTPVLAPDGATVWLRTSEGRVVARYGELAAYDAGGQALATRMEVKGTAIQLHIEDRGAAYPLLVDPLLAVEEATLLAGIGPGDGYAISPSVAISGDTAFLGVQWEESAGEGYAGAVYVFVRDNGVWTEQQKLVPSDVNAFDWFGTVVAASGDTLVVGSPEHDPGGALDAGAIYVFVRDSSGVWTEQQKLVASDAAPDDRLGDAVALSGDTIVAGTSWDEESAGAAYVFVQSGGVWTEQQKLVASDADAFDAFGTAVAVSGDTILAGATGDYSMGIWGGAAYVFTRSGGVWTEQQKLVASDAAMNDAFGSAVAMNDDTLFVAASPYSSVGVYVFGQSGGVWTEQQKFEAAPSEWFGGTLAVSGERIAVGAASEAGAPLDKGDVYVFGRSGAAWAEQAHVMVTDATTYYFGSAVALSGDTLIVAEGASMELQAKAHVYRLVPAQLNGAPCAMAQECRSGVCADGVCCDTACDGPAGCQACDVPGLVGTCSPRADGEACDDGSACTQGDACQAGACAGAAVVCGGEDACHEPGVCDPEAGACSSPAKPDGTPCAGGECVAGACVPPGTSSPDSSAEDSGCGCRVGRTSTGGALWLLAGALLLLSRRERPRRAAGRS